MTTSFWLDSLGDWIGSSLLDRHSEYDVIIIGGGMSGLSTAYYLTLKGIRCAVLEKGGLCSGATGTNGGIIKTSITSLKRNTEKYGLEVAINLIKYSDFCIQEIQTVIDTLNIECELRFNGTLVAASNPSELEGLMGTYSFMIENGVDCHWWTAEECQQKTTRKSLLGGVFCPKGGNLWAAKVVFGLANWIVEHGSFVFTGAAVESVQKDENNKFVLSTNRGVFQSSHVVYACNAWSRQILPELEKIIIPVRNQVITTRPVDPIWQFTIVTNDGYEYMMQRPDRRIVLGKTYCSSCCQLL
jgi:gamma-glutamylputrescine oxidase